MAPPTPSNGAFHPALVLLSLLLASCGGDGEGKTPAGGVRETVTVATANDFVPFEFVDDETGELTGFDIELIRAIAEEAGVAIEIETMEFDGLIAGMRTGRYGVGIAGITITEERDEFIDYSRPYYDAGLILAVRADETGIGSAADLAGKQVGTRAGTTSEAYLKEHHGDAEIVAFPGIVEAYMDLQAGRVDAVLYDAPNVNHYVNSSDDVDFKVVGDLLQGEQYGIAFPEGSALRDRFDAALGELMEDGTYDRIYAKWFGEGAGDG